jgi:hypothetical protein
MARVMGALGGFETIEPREDFAMTLWQKIDEWEARKKVFWLAALAGFVRRRQRLLVASAAVFVVTLLTSVFVLQHVTRGPSGVRVADRGVPAEARASEVSESYVMREIRQPAEAGSDTAYMHYVTGDRQVYPVGLQEDWAYRPVVRPVSGAKVTF